MVLVHRVFVPKGKRSPQSLELGPGDNRLTVAARGPGARSITQPKGNRRNLKVDWSVQPRTSHVTSNSDQQKVLKSGQKPELTAGD